MYTANIYVYQFQYQYQYVSKKMKCMTVYGTLSLSPFSSSWLFFSNWSWWNSSKTCHGTTIWDEHVCLSFYRRCLPCLVAVFCWWPFLSQHNQTMVVSQHTFIWLKLKCEISLKDTYYQVPSETKTQVNYLECSSSSTNRVSNTQHMLSHQHVMGHPCGLWFCSMSKNFNDFWTNETTQVVKAIAQQSFLFSQIHDLLRQLGQAMSLREFDSQTAKHRNLDCPELQFHPIPFQDRHYNLSKLHDFLQQKIHYKIYTTGPSSATATP